MSAAGGLLSVAFGDLALGVWGAGLVLDEQTPFLCVGGRGAVASPEGALHAGEPGEPWRLAGDGLELVVEPVGDPVTVSRPDADVEGFDQLCRVSGSFVLDGTEQEVSCRGCRGRRVGERELTQFESLREVAAWFEPGDGLALAAFRPRKAKGQDADLVTASVLDGDGSSAVEDPRLSTTYAADGWPSRASLELWLGGEEEDQHLLRRATGEAAGGRVRAAWGEREVRAELFRWNSRGHDGAGVYLLARSQ
jgi:hypothetical protein